MIKRQGTIKYTELDPDFDEEEYEVYEPLLAGLRDDEQIAAFQNLWFLLRRVLLVFSVILLEDNYY